MKSAFKRYGIVKMKADWTNADPVITKTLKQFGRVGVPLYVLYPASAPNKPIVLPELLTQASGPRSFSVNRAESGAHTK